MYIRNIMPVDPTAENHTTFTIDESLISLREKEKLEREEGSSDFRASFAEKRAKMGGGHGHGEGTTYKGLTMHQPKRWHTVTGKGLCAVMWFWILYRAKQDGPVVLGWRHPWEGHGDHGHDEH